MWLYKVATSKKKKDKDDSVSVWEAKARGFLFGSGLFGSAVALEKLRNASTRKVLDMDAKAEEELRREGKVSG